MPPGRWYLAREGYPFILLGILMALLGFWIFWPVGILFGVFALFCFYFFRDPRRSAPEDSQILVSPADGKILKIERVSSAPYYPEPHQKISIFMSPLDVHVNGIPCDGVVKEIHYRPGKFFVASLDKASELNERNVVVMENNRGQRVAFTQIAGLVARRIVCYLDKGLRVRRGERYGLIRFGSRMEVCVPTDWEMLVRVGERVRGVASALARMKE